MDVGMIVVMSTKSRENLSDDEMRFWHAVKGMGQHVRRRIAEDITRETGLSDPDFAVLFKLCRGDIKQSDLALAIEWHRSRLSHHLSRMEERGLVRREAHGAKGVTVAITEAGRKLAAKARPAHAEAVRKHLIDPLTPEEREIFKRIAAKLMRD
jgi:DNA-binding MarR family transcriptional regulator